MDYLHFAYSDLFSSASAARSVMRRIIDEGFGLVGRHAAVFSRVPRTTMQVVRIEANFYFDFGAM